jgi:DNA-binding XRE family transcriptional regulator
MIEHTNHTVINDDSGHPQFVVIPYNEYVQRFQADADEALIPNAVVRLQVANDCTLMEAWRRHLKLSQADVAAQLGTSLPNYAKIEKNDNPRSDTIARVAAAMDIDTEQLTE